MTGLTALLIALAAFWVLAYIGVPLLVWTGAAAIYLLGLWATGLMGMGALQVSLVIFGVLALLFNLPLLRRMLVTRPVFAGFKKVLPEMTSTEREALEAGAIWWEGEMFRGKPDWDQLLNFQRTQLTREEQSFLDNECNQLCAMVDDWKIQFELKDLPEEVWSFIRNKGFMSMLISKQWGGLGFSAYAQSCVVTKLATRSTTAAVTVMVPNSLGPGELLMHYGTEEQKKKWLPGLAAGKEIPCFGLTGPDAGSDAGAIPDVGIVCFGEWEGKRVLGMKLRFKKRYITLAPVATVVGLALKLHDPDGLLGDKNKTEYGITCALVPANLPGIKIGSRAWPCNTPFMNGSIAGNDAFVPIDAIIGGQAMAGKGWRMLVECLSAGRGISLPALSAAAGKAGYFATGAYTRIRRQFKMPIGKFEGVQEAMGRIAGYTYQLEAMRSLTASAVDYCQRELHKGPSVVTAIAKYHMTEMMRQVLIDAMDIHGGRGVMQGPRNYLAQAYQAVPIAITVEGSNILTRNLMIYGQGSIRCHPFVFPEMEAARKDDLAEFDKLFFSHIGFSLNRGIRALTLGLTGGLLADSPMPGPTAKYFKALTRMSAAMAFVSDVTMLVVGGELKRKERLSARLGDVLSHLYMASCVLKYYYDEGQSQEDLPHVEWCLQNSLAEINKAFDQFFANFPVRPVAWFLRFMAFPLGRSYTPPSDRLSGVLANMMMEPTALKARLTREVYVGESKDDQSGRMKHAYEALLKIEPLYNKFQKAIHKDKIGGFGVLEQLANCVKAGALTQAEADQLKVFEELRLDAILTDHFTKEYIQNPFEAAMMTVPRRAVA
ncbi:MAG: acyl-CoA dehydrogenase [Nevskiales bacterium]